MKNIVLLTFLFASYIAASVQSVNAQLMCASRPWSLCVKKLPSSIPISNDSILTIEYVYCTTFSSGTAVSKSLSLSTNFPDAGITLYPTENPDGLYVKQHILMHCYDRLNVQIPSMEERAVYVYLTGYMTPKKYPTTQSPLEERTIVDYQLIEGGDITDKVIKAIKSGWQPFGGISAWGGGAKTQAMVKYK